MNCLECQELLQRRLDGEPLADSAALEQHLRVCPTCREQHQSAQLMLDGLRAASPPMAPEYLAPRIVAAVVQDQRMQWRVRRRVWMGVAVAASLLLMALAGYLWFPRDRNGPGPDVIGKKDNRPKEEAPSLGRSMEEARAAMTNLTERLADRTKKQAQLILAAANPMDLSLPPPPPLEVPADAARSLQQAGQGVGEGVQTVARSARRAMSYFAREFAALEPSARN